MRGTRWTTGSSAARGCLSTMLVYLCVKTVNGFCITIAFCTPMEAGYGSIHNMTLLTWLQVMSPIGSHYPNHRGNNDHRPNTDDAIKTAFRCPATVVGLQGRERRMAKRGDSDTMRRDIREWRDRKKTLIESDEPLEIKNAVSLSDLIPESDPLDRVEIFVNGERHEFTVGEVTGKVITRVTSQGSKFSFCLINPEDSTL